MNLPSGFGGSCQAVDVLKRDHPGCNFDLGSLLDQDGNGQFGMSGMRPIGATLLGSRR